MAWALQEAAGVPFASGFAAALAGDVPLGAGLSSSASLQASLAAFLLGSGLPPGAAWPADDDARMALADDGEVRMESVSGDLTVVVPKDLSAEVSGESFSGDLAAPGARVKREKFGPGASLDARYGAGKGSIRLETFSGDAELRWK